ncbi:MAG: hypothetical protein WBS20_15355 [Lysobacterales bacterium]
MIFKRSNGKRISRGWLLVGLTVVFVIGSGAYFLTAGIRDTKKLEQTLIDRFGLAYTYTPSPDGSIAPERTEAFIRVRNALQSACTSYQAVLAGIGGLDKLESDQELSAGKSAKTGLKGFKSVFSIGPEMVAFVGRRNQALLDENMGLGEYLYIYLTSYAEQLAAEPASAEPGMEEAYVSDRAREEYARILANQLLALETAGPADLAVNLRMELSALKDSLQTSPWPVVPAGKARESLAPYQEQLAGLYCSGIVRTELLQKNRGFQLDG